MFAFGGFLRYTFISKSFVSIYTKARKYVNTTDLGISRLAGEVLRRTRPNAICIPNLANANVYNVSSTWTFRPSKGSVFACQRHKL